MLQRQKPKPHQHGFYTSLHQLPIAYEMNILSFLKEIKLHSIYLKRNPIFRPLCNNTGVVDESVELMFCLFGKKIFLPT